MSDFISILPLPAPLDRDGLRRLARHGCLDIHRVHWVRAYLDAQGARMLCWYQAHDAESVRLVLRHQGAAETAVWAAQAGSGLAADREADGRDCVVVELADAAAGTPTTAQEAVSAWRGPVMPSPVRSRHAAAPHEYASSGVRTRRP